jgi:hypothetical protein
MRDEIDHARIGWGYLAAPAVTESVRSVLGAWLPRLVEIVREAWMRRADDLPRTIPAGHGCIGGAELPEVIDRALTELVLPGFAHVGVRPRS